MAPKIPERERQHKLAESARSERLIAKDPKEKGKVEALLGSEGPKELPQQHAKNQEAVAEATKALAEQTRAEGLVAGSGHKSPLSALAPKQDVVSSVSAGTPRSPKRPEEVRTTSRTPDAAREAPMSNETAKILEEFKSMNSAEQMFAGNPLITDLHREGLAKERLQLGYEALRLPPEQRKLLEEACRNEGDSPATAAIKHLAAQHSGLVNAKFMGAKKEQLEPRIKAAGDEVFMMELTPAEQRIYEKSYKPLDPADASPLSRANDRAALNEAPIKKHAEDKAEREVLALKNPALQSAMGERYEQERLADGRFVASRPVAEREIFEKAFQAKVAALTPPGTKIDSPLTVAIKDLANTHFELAYGEVKNENAYEGAIKEAGEKASLLSPSEQKIYEAEYYRKAKEADGHFVESPLSQRLRDETTHRPPTDLSMLAPEPQAPPMPPKREPTEFEKEYNRADSMVSYEHRTSDGRFFKKRDDAERYAEHKSTINGINGRLPSADAGDSTFTSGKGYVQHTPAEVAQFREEVESAIKRQQQPLIYQFLVDPLGAARVANPELRQLIDRHNRIDSEGREWASPHLAEHPTPDAVAVPAQPRPSENLGVKRVYLTTDGQVFLGAAEAPRYQLNLNAAEAAMHKQLGAREVPGGSHIPTYIPHEAAAVAGAVNGLRDLIQADRDFVSEPRKKEILSLLDAGYREQAKELGSLLEKTPYHQAWQRLMRIDTENREWFDANLARNPRPDGTPLAPL